MKGIIWWQWEHCPLGRKEGSTGSLGRSAQGRLKSRVGWCRSQRQVQEPGHLEERGPQRPRPLQYLDVFYKVINISFQLPRVFRGPLNNHLLVLLGVIGTG